MKKNVEALEQLFNNKPLLKKLAKQVNSYSSLETQMDGIKEDMKEILTAVKEEYKITPAIFKQIVKLAKSKTGDDIDDKVESLTLIKDIAEEVSR